MNNGGFLNIFDPFIELVDKGRSKKWQPCIDVFETEEYFFIVSELPGVDKNNLKIYIKETTLIISGEKKQCSEVDCNFSVKYHRIEIPTGKFEREINIPSYVMFENMTVKYENSNLEIIFKKNDKTVITVE
ncbi:MAG: Hsp20/alpha crystallin family protein [Candidatus Muirbacterium halophilum]|nr:Hsp20/alpha crystallin family protein [Candidatus Muirbacterium halophilum]MCK9474742.1 Hsp20/alpha crystallin family protein [Candidatus Muirbacterium halophilum]